MLRLNYLFALLVGVFVFACQGEQGVPSGPGGGLDLSAGGPCKSNAFTAAAGIYVDSNTQNTKLQACKDILTLVKQGSVGAAELAIDGLIVAVYTEYTTTPSVLQAVGSNSLAQSVADYIDAACGLAPSLGASECLRPKDQDQPVNGIDDDDFDAYLAAGPLFSSGTTLATGVLGTGGFAFGVEEADGAYVFVTARPRTGLDGPCPGNFPNDCEDDVYDVDADGEFTSVAVETCEVYAERHIRCPAGGDCEFGELTAPLNLVSCTVAGYDRMGLFGQLAYQATRPMQWIVHATPAHAGVTTKFGAFSPVVGADGDPRRRTVEVNVTANYPSGSEGTVIQILQLGIVIESCVTVATGDYTSTCSMNPLVPEDLSLLITAAKTGGDGAYNASQSLTLGPANPERGVTKTVTFVLNPPGGGRGKNK